MTDIVFIYVTHPELDAALVLGRRLVEEGLAACANVFPGTRSIYRWQGQVEEASEVVMILKTRAELLPDVQARVRAEHPYAGPCVAALPVAGGDPGYLAWILGSCGGGAGGTL